MKKVLVIDTDNATEVMDFVDQLRDMDLAQAKTFIDNSSEPGNLLAEFEAEVGLVYGHYTEDPKKKRVEVKIVAIPDGLEGEQIEKGDTVRVLILEGEKK